MQIAGLSIFCFCAWFGGAFGLTCRDTSNKLTKCEPDVTHCYLKLTLSVNQQTRSLGLENQHGYKGCAEPRESYDCHDDVSFFSPQFWQLKSNTFFIVRLPLRQHLGPTFATATKTIAML